MKQLLQVDHKKEKRAARSEQSVSFVDLKDPDIDWEGCWSEEVGHPGFYIPICLNNCQQANENVKSHREQGGNFPPELVWTEGGVVEVVVGVEEGVPPEKT